MSHLRRYVIAGLLIWVPLAVTVLVIKLMVDIMDRTLLLLPAAYHPDVLLGLHIPGLGVVLTITVVLVTGIVVANFFGQQLVDAWERLLARIPLVRSIYSGAKQVSETLFAPGGQSFRKVLLIEYPRRGLWTVAFQTGTTVGEAQTKTRDEVVNVYMPTTPNPTSGFFLMVPKQDTIELDMSVDEGLKMIISMGVIVPGPRTKPLGSTAPVATPGA
ncbi:MAG: DUF502 domain-containing protein [Gammaproteobacteria bacterium]|nr:DUF502 domain-containing protein [Gammaproteobacteria bacterium]